MPSSLQRAQKASMIVLLGLALAPHAVADPKLATQAPHAAARMARVGPGSYRPLYPSSPNEREVAVLAFLLDVRPVNNAEFLSFVNQHDEWRRDRVKRVFADGDYLSHWQTDADLGRGVRPRAPVTHVSWFAAKAYCAARGARLPSEREWELAALASKTKADGSKDPVWQRRILAWYAEPAGEPVLGDAGRGAANFWGIRDLHGLVWEWVYDFGASLVTSDSREKGVADGNRFCGGAAANARDPADYATFMRIAFRSSLEAPYTSGRLGFRCAKSIAAERSP